MATITDNNPYFLLSGNASDVLVSGYDPSSEAIVVVLPQGDGAGEISLQLPASVENPELDLRALVEGAPLKQPAILPTATAPYDCLDPIPNLEIRITKDGGLIQSVKHVALVGGIAGKSAVDAALSLKHWLTQRPQVNKACRWGREQLFASIHPDHGARGESIDVSVKATIYAASGISTVMIAEASVLCGGVLAIPVGFAALDHQGAVAWDVWIELSCQMGDEISKPVRFVLEQSKTNWRGFLYRNALGGFDSLYSKGDLKFVPQYEPTAFKNGHAEEEKDPSAVEYLEVDTGMFGSAAERMMWLDFLRSKEKYMVEQDGTVSRIILDEASPELTLKELGHFSFRFHKAEDLVGNGVVLPDYEEELPVPEGHWSDNLWLNGKRWEDNKYLNTL